LVDFLSKPDHAAWKIGQFNGKSEEKRENMQIVNFLHFQFTKPVMPLTILR